MWAISMPPRPGLAAADHSGDGREELAIRQGISEILTYAVGVAISPVPIIAVILVFLVVGVTLIAKGLAPLTG